MLNSSKLITTKRQTLNLIFTVTQHPCLTLLGALSPQAFIIGAGLFHSLMKQ